ncbi:MAG: hypothetical protein LBS27_03735 [Bifidobacteriaceae bacterium]|jgi:DNA-directed RNA polymerase subunit RPC12/RpoP|nr:hypothetical protein [Bifidobacteriaceae bacterium]
MDHQIPSLYHLRCPNCGSGEYTPLGKKRNLAQQVAVGFAAGAAPLLATVVANAQARDLTEIPPLEYKCAGCKKKYQSGPLAADPSEILAEPCVVNFTRAKKFQGAAGVYTIYLNGVPINTVRNGQSFAFQTILRYNTLFAGFGNGMLYRVLHRFEAVPGRTIGVVFDGVFRPLP